MQTALFIPSLFHKNSCMTQYSVSRKYFGVVLGYLHLNTSDLITLIYIMKKGVCQTDIIA